jgi:hypothetical protein
MLPRRCLSRLSLPVTSGLVHQQSVPKRHHQSCTTLMSQIQIQHSRAYKLRCPGGITLSTAGGVFGNGSMTADFNSVSATMANFSRMRTEACAAGPLISAIWVSSLPSMHMRWRSFFGSKCRSNPLGRLALGKGRLRTNDDLLSRRESLRPNQQSTYQDRQS